MPVHVPYAFGAYAHPVRIPAAGGGVGTVVRLGEGKDVGVAVVGVAVVGVAVAGVAVVGVAVVGAASQIDLPTVGTTRILP